MCNLYETDETKGIGFQKMLLEWMTIILSTKKIETYRFCKGP